VSKRDHRHRAVPKLARTVTYSGPVSRWPIVAAHGGVTVVDQCRCGAERRSNHSCGHVEYGPWRDVEYGPPRDPLVKGRA